jgi:DNA polymerase-3 subunit delta
MISLLTGENTFELQRAIDELVRSFTGSVERIDGSELEIRDLPDLLMGTTLFAPQRLVVVKDLSQNTTLWTELGDWLPRIHDAVHVVFVEPKPDKRTKTYKLLKEQSEVREFPIWKEGDIRTAEVWVAGEVASRGLTLDQPTIRDLVSWVGAEQWELHYALEKLAVLDDVTPEVIREVIDTTPADNVFHVFETALRGDRATLRRVLATLEHSEDGYRLFGLLANQAYQLATVAVSDKPASEVARTLGVHPYALSKLQPHADRLGRAGARRIIHRLAEADHRVKTGNDDIWVVLETALAGIAD